MLHQPAQVGQRLVVVLAPGDALLDINIECLHAHLQLQRSGWKLRNQRLQPIRQMVGNDLEVHEQVA